MTLTDRPCSSPWARCRSRNTARTAYAASATVSGATVAFGFDVVRSTNVVFIIALGDTGSSDVDKLEQMTVLATAKVITHNVPPAVPS